MKTSLRFRNRSARARSQALLEALEDRTLFSVFTVTNTLDNGSVGSLPWAVTQANANPGANTINFSPTAFKTHQTITLVSGFLTLSNTSGPTTITGPKAGLTLSGADTTWQFTVNANVTASVSGVTMTDGYAGYQGVGGAIAVYPAGTLSLSQCTVSNCYGQAGGGGIFNEGNLTLNDCSITGNSTGNYGEGGGIESFFGTVSVTSPKRFPTPAPSP